MLRNLFILLSGVILGSVVTLIFTSNDEYETPPNLLNGSSDRITEIPQSAFENADSNPTAVESLAVNTEDSGRTDLTEPNQVSVGEPSDKPTVFVHEFELEEPYASMVRSPEQPKRLRTPELFQKFLDDDRDNAWADSMEAGMKQVEAELGAKYQTAFDSVECRSRYCVIAGVTYSQEPQPWNPIMAELTSSGWWQGAGGTSISATSSGSETHFFSIISREPVDTLRDPGSEMKKTDESGLKVASLDNAIH